MSRKTRKLIWSAPLVAVLAVAGALAIFAALSPNWAQAHDEATMAADPPGAATGLTAEPDGYNAIVLKWNPPASTSGGGATGYRIDISEMPSNSHVWQFHETIGVNVSGAKHTYTDRMDLSAGDQRRYRVTGFNDAGVGATSILPSSIVGATAPPTVPGPVIRLRARSGTGDDAGSILLSWTEPTDTGGEDIAVYCIVASTDRTLVVVQAPSMDNCDEDADVPHMRMGTGDFHSIAVSGKSTAYKHSGTFDGSTGDVPTPPVTELVPGSTWYYRAYGANSEGRSTIASNIDDARVATGARPPTVGAPMDLRVVWADDNSSPANVYWNWPAGSTETAETAFQLQRSTSSSFPTTGTTTTLSVTISNLADALQSMDTGTTVDDERVLYYRVRAGTGGRWSNTALRPSEMDDEDGESVIIPNPNPRPVIHTSDDANTDDVDEMPRAVEAEGEDGYTVIDLTWRPDLGNATTPIARPSGYEIDRRTGAGPWQRLQSDTTYTSSEYSDPGLRPGTMYEYRIFPLFSSVRLGGRSMPVYGAPVEVSTMTREPSSPDPVRGLTVTADGPTAFNLEWDRVTETGGAVVKFYLVQVVDDGDKDHDIDVGAEGDWPEANGDGKGRTDATTTEYRYEPTSTSALRGGDVRWFRVFPINQANSAADGDEDDLLDDMVTDTALDKGAAEPKRGQTDDAVAPDPPVNLSAETARDSSGMEVPDRGVLLIWNMPDDPKGATIAHYVVERKIDSGEWEELGKTSDGSPDDRTYFNDRDKQVPGELRTYRVAAVSDTDAQGGWSDEAGFMDGQASHSHNTVPMAEGMIDPVTVTAGMMSEAMDVSDYFSDADTDDTLTYTASVMPVRHGDVSPPPTVDNMAAVW